MEKYRFGFFIPTESLPPRALPIYVGKALIVNDKNPY
jgi:hypothetical protein